MCKSTYELQKCCKHCGALITDKNKTGYCRYCYPKYGMFGENNPFYGKTHTKEVIEKIKISSSKSSKEHWKNEKYRNKVINAITGLKRTDTFKETQRQNAKKQFLSEYQREIRSKKMKESWQNGSIVYTEKPSINISKQQIKFTKLLSEHYKGNIVLNETIQYKTEDNKKRWLFPDILLPDINLVIEYNGDYWHANPSKYNSTDLIKNKTAKEIWEQDKNKKGIYENLGYTVYYVWSSDFIKDSNNVINRLINFIDNGN